MMRKYILSSFIFLAACMFAALPAKPRGFMMGFSAGGGGGTTFLVDSLSGAPVIALSSRKLRSAYAGNAIQVRRSSDNSTQNIGFSNNNLDTASLASFVGANNGFIATFYDQTVNGSNATQVTNSNQPRVVSAGVNDTINSRVALRSVAASITSLLFPASLTLSQPVSIAVLFQFTGGTFGHLFDGSSAARNLFGTSAGPVYQLFAGTPNSAGSADSSLHSAFAIFNGASSNLFVDGSQLMNNVSAGTQAFGDGVNPEEMGLGQSSPSDVLIGEVIIFNSVISAGDRATIRTSWQSYWGAP